MMETMNVSLSCSSKCRKLFSSGTTSYNNDDQNRVFAILVFILLTSSTKMYMIVFLAIKMLALPGEVSLSRTIKAPSLLCSRRVCSACFLVIFPWNQLDNKNKNNVIVLWSKQLQKSIIVIFTDSAITVNLFPNKTSNECEFDGYSIRCEIFGVKISYSIIAMRSRFSSQK